MNETLKNKSGWRILRRLLIASAILATLIAVFYAEEDWRGKRAWENCKRELEAKGVDLDWNDYITARVPDDQNFFKAPKMTEWFQKWPAGYTGPFTNELSGLSTNVNTTATNLNETIAVKYLAWSDQFQPDFDLIREALKRPYARMDGDYSKPYEQPIPNFVAVRALAQLLAKRAKCDLLLGQPDKALQELTLLHDFRHLLEGAPAGKPMTLVAAMINVAVTGLYVDTIAGGLQSRAWQEPQLAALQKQLANVNLTPFVFEAILDESAGVCRIAQIAWIPKIFDSTIHATWTTKVVWWFWPSGWTYQNMVNVAMLEQKPLEAFDLAHDTVAPRKIDEATREPGRFANHGEFPFKILAAIAIPNFSKAFQTTAHNQTMVNEAQIVCALERYRLAHGEYAETLDVLVPQFIEKLPHDIIGGQPLHYRRTDDENFLLYSVGWNETDDGGLPGTLSDVKNGDWVWQAGK